MLTESEQVLTTLSSPRFWFGALKSLEIFRFLFPSAYHLILLVFQAHLARLTALSPPNQPVCSPVGFGGQNSQNTSKTSVSCDLAGEAKLGGAAGEIWRESLKRSLFCCCEVSLEV